MQPFLWQSVVKLMEYGFHHESEAVVAVGEKVFLQRKSTPAVDATETNLSLVDEKVCVIHFLDLRRVGVGFPWTAVKTLDRIIES